MLKSTCIQGIRHDFCLKVEPNVPNFVAWAKKDIEKAFEVLSLKFRFATLSDIVKISDFQKKVFSPHTATLETAYELFRIIKFGYALLLESAEETIVGCYTTVHYGDKERNAYGIRVGVSPLFAGHNVAVYLAKYATLLAFESGATVFRALMSPTNLRSASNVLNHIGYHCETYHRDLPAFGTRFEIALPLNLDSLRATEIDFDKVKSFVKEQEMGNDFLLLRPTDIQAMESVYKEGHFKIIAFLKKEALVDNDYFFAIKPCGS